MATTKKMFSKSLIRSKRFQDLKGDTVKLFYMMVQLDLDNIGRTQGNKFYLKGKLYERRDDISCEDCGDMLNECSNPPVDLYILYQVKGHWYIQDPFHLNHNKIVGNMATTSLYPPPPEKFIKDWETRTEEVYTVYSHCIPEDKAKEEDKDKTKDKVNTLARFVMNQETILEHAKELYPNKDTTQAIKDFIEACQIKGYKYKAFDMAFYKWVREDRFDQYGGLKKLTKIDPEIVRKAVNYVKRFSRKSEDEHTNMIIQACKRYGDSMVARALEKMNHVSDPGLKAFWREVKR